MRLVLRVVSILSVQVRLLLAKLDVPLSDAALLLDVTPLIARIPCGDLGQLLSQTQETLRHGQVRVQGLQPPYKSQYQAGETPSKSSSKNSYVWKLDRIRIQAYYQTGEHPNPH